MWIEDDVIGWMLDGREYMVLRTTYNLQHITIHSSSHLYYPLSIHLQTTDSPPPPYTTTSPEHQSSRSSSGGISMKPSVRYGSVAQEDYPDGFATSTISHSTLKSFTSLRDEPSKIAFLDSTRTHHHPYAKSILDHETDKCEPYSSIMSSHVSHDIEESIQEDEAEDSKIFLSHSRLRKIALDLSLWINIFILLTKAVAYMETLSLSVLAALVDSVLDVVSQWILAYTERRSSKTRSSAHYPAGAARLEPLGVLSCAALMGFASFGVLKDSFETLYEGVWTTRGVSAESSFIQDENWSSFWSMFSVVFVKLALYALCMKVGHVRSQENDGEDKFYVDSTLEAVAQDHFNDCLSNAVAAVALVVALSNERLWIVDPIGAIIISVYIINSWYETGKEQIEQLTGKAAPTEFIEELYEVANNFDSKVTLCE